MPLRKHGASVPLPVQLLPPTRGRAFPQGGGGDQPPAGGGGGLVEGGAKGAGEETLM